MRIVAIDPGETCGLCVVDTPSGTGLPKFRRLSQKRIIYPGMAAPWLFSIWEGRADPENSVLVLEQYRVFPGAAEAHYGKANFTSEVLGALCGAAFLFAPRLKIVRLEPAEKGRWPVARLLQWLPDVIRRTKGKAHARDAAQLALCFMEKRGLWKPSL